MKTNNHIVHSCGSWWLDYRKLIMYCTLGQKPVKSLLLVQYHFITLSLGSTLASSNKNNITFILGFNYNITYITIPLIINDNSQIIMLQCTMWNDRMVILYTIIPCIASYIASCISHNCDLISFIPHKAHLLKYKQHHISHLIKGTQSWRIANDTRVYTRPLNK